LTLAAAVALAVDSRGSNQLACGRADYRRRNAGRDAHSLGSDRLAGGTNVGVVVPIPGPIIKQDLALDCESAAFSRAGGAEDLTSPRTGSIRACPRIHGRPSSGSKRRAGPLGRPVQGVVGESTGTSPISPGTACTTRRLSPPPSVRGDRGRPSGWTHRRDRLRAAPRRLRRGLADLDFKAHAPRYWTAWDGSRIPWAIGEHAVPVIGYDPVRSTITFVDVLYGVERTMTTQAFAAALTTFDGMGVAVS